MEKGGMVTGSISGERLKRAKLLRKYRLQDLANAFGVSVPAIQKWQQKNGIRKRKLSLVAHHFGVEEWVFTDESLSNEDFEKIILNPELIDKFRPAKDVLSSLPELDASSKQSLGAGSALRSKIHWTSNDTTSRPAPVIPTPAGLWQPAAGSTPSAGNYVYLQSDIGDFIGDGRTYTYTQANAQLSVKATGGHLSVKINGDEDWHGDFQTMISLGELQPGYYGNLKRYAFKNPIAGGLDWSGQGRASNSLIGWFAIDNVVYVNGILKAIDLRFEQHCKGTAAALHGQIHWTY